MTLLYSERSQAHPRDVLTGDVAPEKANEILRPMSTSDAKMLEHACAHQCARMKPAIQRRQLWLHLECFVCVTHESDPLSRIQHLEGQSQSLLFVQHKAYLDRRSCAQPDSGEVLPMTLSLTERLLGPSSSTRSTDCQVPSARSPCSSGSVSDAPRSIARR